MVQELATPKSPTSFYTPAATPKGRLDHVNLNLDQIDLHHFAALSPRDAPPSRPRAEPEEDVAALKARITELERVEAEMVVLKRQVEAYSAAQH